MSRRLDDYAGYGFDVREVRHDEQVKVLLGKPRLGRAIQEFYDCRGEDLERLKARFIEWRDYVEYIGLLREDVVEHDSKVVFVKCAKRGNDVYCSRVRKRLPEDVRYAIQFGSNEREKRTKLLLVTLTWDTKQDGIDGAWRGVGYWFNRWITLLRKNFGRVAYFRVWESSDRGYPHVHLVILFMEKSFLVYRHWDRKKKIWCWRLRVREVRDKMSEGWHSFIDVLGVQEPDKAMSYIGKYISKFYFESKGVLTLALCWLFRKKSYALSKNFLDLIKALRKSNDGSAVSVLKQVRFEEEGRVVVNEWYTFRGGVRVVLRSERVSLDVVYKWEFLGVFSRVDLELWYGRPFNRWRVEASELKGDVGKFNVYDEVFK